MLSMAHSPITSSLPLQFSLVTPAVNALLLKNPLPIAIAPSFFQGGRGEVGNLDSDIVSDI